MGFKSEFNWVLKIKESQGFPEKMEIGKIYDFRKDDKRVYPVGMPIDLIDNSWQTHAKVIIEESTILKNTTKGKFKVVYVYNNEERKILNNILKKAVLNYMEK